MAPTAKTRKSVALKPSTGPRLEALDLYLAADYDRALALVRSAEYKADVAERRILEARILLRSGSAQEGLLAATAARRASKTVDEAILAAALEGSALDRLGKTAAAATAFEAARALARKAHRTVRAELAYFEAIVAWSADELERAEEIVERGLPDADDFVRASLLQMQGWLEIRRERYSAAAQIFQEALEASKRSRCRDIRLEARLVHGLAVVASETIDLRLGSAVEEYAREIAWSRGVARERFNTTTCVRFIAMLRGDLETAYRRGAEAIEQAPSPAFAAIAHANQGALLKTAGDAFASRLHFNDARRAIDSVSWARADVEERVALTNYAIEAAATDRAGAAQCLTLYRSLAGRTDRGLALEGDRRVQAFEDMAEGRVAEHAGDAVHAIRAYEAAFRRWVSLDYRMRAALVAASLRRLTDDVRYDEEIQAALKRAPRAWFGALSGGVVGSRVPRLTPAERRVLAQLLQGKASKQVAETLGRSDYTVRNQTKRVFAAFGVRSRTALFARCVQEGILEELRGPG